jgi:hypothetical protein
MLALATLFLSAFLNTVAQMPPPQAPPPQYPQPASPMQQPLEEGTCLDSLRAVPKVLQPPVSRAMQIVRIDLVLSTATMMPGEIIGFLYTTQDGSTWLGQRSKAYQSAADATAVNQVLAATHFPGESVSGFPPTSEYGVPTKHPELFRVQIPTDAFGPLRITLQPCIVWPPGRPLPDPAV